VDDISFEPETASITGVILYGRLKLFGLLGREEDTAIPWGDIEKIGTDVLLVRTAVSAPPRSRKKLFGVK
jgi:sporulation protein YlmC with PRC-barrel domain